MRASYIALGLMLVSTPVTADHSIIPNHVHPEQIAEITCHAALNSPRELEREMLMSPGVTVELARAAIKAYQTVICVAPEFKNAFSAGVQVGFHACGHRVWTTIEEFRRVP